ncbi:hypothetical protein NRIC_14020 [Enterococcus florum]|uniref:Oligosaccharide biosynthesis protein Alg14 n=1 Tax=Enterococcus florum TaxID=2480627 RepID=A0A4P5PB52_9ENTE|nr:oligosaccharide biosynthesis protein Alg14 [Enterococcus florum]GCF93511.1 hypothetical protein NRIC_14020 [Enterococcus florum]
MNDHRILLVAKDRELYFFSSIVDLDVCSAHQLFDPAEHDLLRRLPFYELIIFLDYGFDPEMAEHIRPYTKAKIVLFFWNHFLDRHYRLLDAGLHSPAIDQIAHFDPLEARDLGLIHNSSFYSGNMRCPTPQKAYDIFFGAADNGRKQEAMALKQDFDKLALTTYYHILPARGNDQKGYLPYSEYVALMASATSILEIMRAGQFGVTLRTFESSFFRKKLLTENPMIAYYRLYKPENVFQLQQRSFEELPLFLETPFQPIDSEMLTFFEARNWAERFLIHDPQAFERYEYVPELMDQASAL